MDTGGYQVGRDPDDYPLFLAVREQDVAAWESFFESVDLPTAFDRRPRDELTGPLQIVLDPQSSLEMEYVEGYPVIPRATRLRENGQPCQGMVLRHRGNRVREAAYTPQPIGFDLSVNGLGCRQAEAQWSFDYLYNHSQQQEVSGGTVTATARVIDGAVLVAAKLHSGRETDLRAILAVAEEIALDSVTRTSGEWTTTLYGSNWSGIRDSRE